MDFGPSQLFGLDNLSSRHLYQRRPTKECLSLALNEDCVVGECRVVGSSGSG